MIISILISLLLIWIFLFIYRNTRLSKYKYYFAFSDYVIVFASFITTDILLDRYLMKQATFQSLGYPYSLGVYACATTILIFVFQSNNLYKINVILSKVAQSVMLIRSHLYGIMILIILSFIFKFRFVADSRLYILLFLMISLISLLWFRVVILRSIFIFAKKHNIIQKRIIIIGTGRSAQLLAAKLLFDNNSGIKIIGFVDENRYNDEIIYSLKVIGKIKDLPYLKIKENIHEVIIAIDNSNYESLLEIIDICNSLEVNVKLNSELFEIIPQKILTESYAGIPLINTSPQMKPKLSIILKRIFDFTASLSGLIILSPLFAVIGIAIKYSSSGPIFYKQTRIGKDGREFQFYKFRSMKIDDENDVSRQKKMLEFMKGSNGDIGTKIINENRVTAIGKIIRRTSLDELPQLFNVLKGEMSLVGPRPCLPYEYENYDIWQKRRHSVLPGCTGIWQVLGRSEVSFKDSVILDLYYINNMSPWLDLQVILKTIPVMIFARGGK